MGMLMWGASGAMAFLIARIIPAGRNSRWSLPELGAALLGAFAFGVLATALDFGGWGTLDWRAALFTFLGAMAATGLVRAVILVRSRRAA